MSLQPKITDLIKCSDFTYSLEVTPVVKLEEIDKLSLNPVFFSVTWHSRSHRCDSLDIAPLNVAKELKKRGKNVLLHLSCDLLKKEFLNKLLDLLREEGICNLFTILGESYDANSSDFKSTIELIKHIKENDGNFFCVGVAGFPDKDENKLRGFKEKIDAGADYILTQAFFEQTQFKDFVQKCHKSGIRVPVIPGLFLFETYKQLTTFTNLCGIKVTQNFQDFVKKSEKTGKGFEITKKLLLDINSSGLGSHHFHFFTLNKFEIITKFIAECKELSSGR